MNPVGDPSKGFGPPPVWCVRMVHFLMLSGMVVFAGCGGGADAGGAVGGLVISSDRALAERAEALLPALAARAGLELSGPVRLERRSRAELERYLTFKLAEELPAETAELTEAVYRLLGLLDAEADLHAIIEDVYLEQVAGFYDPDSTMLFVLDDQSDDVLETLLVHELVHAMQDQVADLSAVTDRRLGNDRQGAAQAAIEGHATLIMLEYSLGIVQDAEIDIRDFPNFTETVRPSLEAAREQSPALLRAPRIVQEALLFPYLGGTAFVEALWKSDEGRTLPLGSNLPTSTEQILHPERFVGAADEPTELRLFFDGVQPIFEDGLGEMETSVFLETLLGADGAHLAVGWDGDRYALFGDVDAGYSLVWVSVWDEADARDAFAEALSGARGRLPGDASIESVDVSGRPGAVVRVGGSTPRTVRIESTQGG